MGAHVDIPYRVPAGIAYFWGSEGEASPSVLQGRSDRRHIVLGPGLVVSLPDADGPEVFDSALFTARELLDRFAADGRNMNALVFPGVVESRESRLQLVSDSLLEDLRRRPPDLAPGVVHVTGHASRELEAPWSLGGSPDYSGPSGRSRTLWTVAGPSHGLSSSQRNAKVLRRATAMIDGPQLERTLAGLRQHTVVCVVGELGVGKSRTVAESLAGLPVVLARSWGDRGSWPSLLTQVAEQMTRLETGPGLELPADLRAAMADGWAASLATEQRRALEGLVLGSLRSWSSMPPLTLVLDDLHRCGEDDRRLVSELIDSATESLRLVLIGRPNSWLDGLDCHRLALEPLGGDLDVELHATLTEGLGVPQAVIDRFRSTCAGNPFAAEEGLHNLVRRRLLREHYGSFFFNGSRDVEYLPTARLVRHLVSEALRMDALLVAFRAAAAAGSVPRDLFGLDGEGTTGAVQRLVAAGLLRETGDSVRCANGAFHLGLRQCMEDHVVARVREELVAPTLVGGSAEQLWSSYQELAGTPRGTEVLLNILALPKEQRPHRGLFDALVTELRELRARGGDPATEFELLWAYFPLARRHGEAGRLIEDIERALELCHPSDQRRMALLALHSEESLMRGSLENAEEKAVEGLNLARQQDPRRQSVLLLQLGKVLQRQDRYEEAKKLLLGLAESIDPTSHPQQYTACHYQLGNLYLREQDFELALDHHRLALRQRREIGHSTAIGQSLTSLAAINTAIGNYARSLTLYHEALDALGDADPAERAYPLVGIGRTLARLGDFSGATAPLRESLELRLRRADRLGIEISRLALAHNLMDLQELDQALDEARQILFRLTMVGSRRYKAAAQSLVGQVLLRQERLSEAFDHLQDAAHQHRQIDAEVPALFAEAMALDACLALDNVPGVELRSQILAERLATAPYPELGERLDLRLHRGWELMRTEGMRAGDSRVPLARAFGELQRKTGMLDAELRGRFLYSVPENRTILDLALGREIVTREGLDGILAAEVVDAF